MKTVQLSEDIIALYQSRAGGSEVLLFQRNSGFIGRVSVQQQGTQLENRLLKSINKIAETVPTASPENSEIGKTTEVYQRSLKIEMQGSNARGHIVNSPSFRQLSF